MPLGKNTLENPSSNNGEANDKIAFVNHCNRYINLSGFFQALTLEYSIWSTSVEFQNKLLNKYSKFQFDNAYLFFFD